MAQKTATQEPVVYLAYAGLGQRYQVGRTTLHRMVKRPDFPQDAIIRVGRSVRFDVAKVDAFLSQAQNEG